MSARNKAPVCGGDRAKLVNILMNNKINLCYTILLFFNHFAYGISINIIGATLVDLRIIYDVSLETISYIPVAVSIGYLIGSLVGLLYKWLNRQLMLTILVILLAATIGLVPNYGSFVVLIIALTFCGIGDGGYDAGSTTWIVEMWPTANSVLLQAAQFMYGVGSVMAPIIVAPYVYGERTTTIEAQNRTSIPLSIDDRIRGLTIPFAINGALQAIAPIFLLILYFIRPYSLTKTMHSNETIINDNRSSNEIDNSIKLSKIVETNKIEDISVTAATTTTSKIHNRIGKLILCGMCLSLYATGEIGYFCYSTAMFQYLEIRLSASQSAAVMSLLSATFTIGRLAAAFIAAKLQPCTMIGIHYVMIIVGLVTLFLGQNHLPLIYLSTALLGFGFSAMWSAYFAFTARHLRLTDRVTSSFLFAFGTTSLAIPFVLGQTFERDPLSLMWLVAAFVAVSAILFVALRFWIYRDEKCLRAKDDEQIQKNRNEDSLTFSDRSP